MIRINDISIENTFSVTSIGNYTFYECLSLTQIKIPSSVTLIEKNNFQLK